MKKRTRAVRKSVDSATEASQAPKQKAKGKSSSVDIVSKQTTEAAGSTSKKARNELDTADNEWDQVVSRPADVRKLQSAALRWYDRNGRKLPWRSTANPYRIWLSEIMLQQTTVAAVVPYFERFLAAFPSVNDLAAADVDRVLRLWEGLGYYSRARNLHKAAQQICEHHAGSFPADVESLNALPGVGRYTAGAIASFAFNLPAPIVEANTERLYARILGLPVDVKSSAGQKSLWSFASRIVPKNRAGDFNQAMMDIGANVCTPQNPRCDECPVMQLCRAFATGLQNEIPVRKARVAITDVDEAAIVLVQNGTLLLRRRTAAERWAGMWDFPRIELSSDDCERLDECLLAAPSMDSSPKRTRRGKSLFERVVSTLPDSVCQQTHSLVNYEPEQIIAATQFRYSVTRYRVTLRAMLCHVDQKARVRTTGSSVESQNWFQTDELSGLPLSQTGRRIADWASEILRLPKYQQTQPESSNEATSA